jgi:hypothetical protein
MEELSDCEVDGCRTGPLGMAEHLERWATGRARGAVCGCPAVAVFGACRESRRSQLNPATRAGWRDTWSARGQ